MALTTMQWLDVATNTVCIKVSKLKYTQKSTHLPTSMSRIKVILQFTA